MSDINDRLYFTEESTLIKLAKGNNPGFTETMPCNGLEIVRINSCPAHIVLKMTIYLQLEHFVL